MSNAAPIRQSFIAHMDQALEHLRRDLSGLRTGRASVALLDGIRVDYYGTMTPLKQISTSLLERVNGTMRQHVAPLQRKTRSFAKRRTALDTQTQLFKSYYNLCRKHGSLKGQTPAQTAGLSDHTIFGERLQTRQTDNQFNEL